MTDTDLSITYEGRISGDEMKLNRTAGDFAPEVLVAKRIPTETSTENK